MRRGKVKIGAGMLAAGLALSMAIGSPADARRDKNPNDICAFLAEDVPDAYEFLNTKPGGCVSSVASVGVEALMAGAFPSTAAAVGNCKFLESTFFMHPDEPNPGGPYPYQFYWWWDGSDEQYFAKNRADCLRLLEAFHTGQLDPAPTPPPDPE